MDMLRSEMWNVKFDTMANLPLKVPANMLRQTESLDEKNMT